MQIAPEKDQSARSLKERGRLAHLWSLFKKGARAEVGMSDVECWMEQSHSLGHFWRAVRFEGHAARRRMEWRLEAAMIGKDGFPAVVVQPRSSDSSHGSGATDCADSHRSMKQSSDSFSSPFADLFHP